MSSLRVPGSRRVHMTSDANSRKRFVAAIADMNVEARLYVASTKGGSQRRARSDCLRRLTPDLIGVGVCNLYLESCDQDRADRLVLTASRAEADADHSFYFDHRRPHEEPMLWIPDVIAWAWGKDRVRRARVSHLVTDVLDAAD